MSDKETRDKETALRSDIDVEQHSTDETITKKKSAVWMAFNYVKTKLRLTDEGATPVNWKCIFLVFISLFASSFNITFLFPFLPEMILSFGYEEVEKGYYSGLVASSMFVGRACGCYFWGWLSDKKGRRPVILITVLLVGICSLVFGFTTNIYFVIITRMLAGLVNGTNGTAKSILYEISDNTNQAVGMSIISISWGLGIVTGPAIGGFLANPCKQYPDTFPSEGLFYQFPYFLPAFFGFVICIVAFIVNVIWLPEIIYTAKDIEITVAVEEGEIVENDRKVSSHYKISNNDTPTFKHFPVKLLEINPRIVSSCGDLHSAANYANDRKEICMARRAISLTDVRIDDAHRLHREHSKDDSHIDNATTEAIVNTDAFIDIGDRAISEVLIENEQTTKDAHKVNESNGVDGDDTNVDKKGDGYCSKMKNWSFVQLIRQHDVLLAVLLYSLFSFGVIGVEDIFSVWASTDIMLDGLGFEPKQIGTVLGITSLPMLFLQLFFFTNLVRRLGIKKTLLICTVILFILTEAMPVLHILVNRPVLLWTLLLSSNIVIKLTMSCVFSATGLIINNSVEPKFAGQVNGLSMTVTSITRSIAPVVGGFVFSWNVGYSSETIGIPFDVSFVFMLFGLVYWVVALFGVTIPDRLNRQKK